MRRAYSEVGWASYEGQEQTYGFCLGFDFCAEHEWGAPYIQACFGLPTPGTAVGLEGRTVTRVPEELVLEKYEWRSSRKGVKQKLPAALLYCKTLSKDEVEALSLPRGRLKKLISSLQVGFLRDPGTDSRHYDPARDDVVCAWSGRGGFAIHVRGAENVQKLAELHKAFQDLDVAFLDASSLGFLRRGPSFVIKSRIPENQALALKARDLSEQRLKEAARACGIENELKAAGKSWHALSPRWEQGEGSELLFFLNPREQHKYGSGWFSVEDLRLWAQDKGPVVESHAIAARLKEQDPDWGYNLVLGLKHHGLGMSCHEKFVKTGPNSQDIGVVLRLRVHSAVHPDGRIDSLDGAGKALIAKKGLFSLEELEPFVSKGRELARKTVGA